MYFRTFFFILFIISSLLFLFSTFYPETTLNYFSTLSIEKLTIQYIQLTALISVAITLILLVISNYYAQKDILKKKEKLATDRLTIDSIHEELERLKN